MAESDINRTFYTLTWMFLSNLSLANSKFALPGFLNCKLITYSKESSLLDGFQPHLFVLTSVECMWDIAGLFASEILIQLRVDVGA